ncbi:MAG: LemA family protein [Candidatus Peribacteraceae bacterium]|nr:LemA family protein [Candidatus Peribacteraceae bacterium]
MPRSGKISVWAIVVGVLVLLGLWLWTGYNGLVTGQTAVQGAWAQVETNYQRRVDLVPNLVATVKGAANFEQTTLQQVTAARTQWMEAPGRQEKLAAAQNMETALGRLLVTVEAYPQLQSVAAFRDLMTQLEGTENRISVARKDYNDAVGAFNITVRRFPTNILALLFGFPQEKFFEAAPGSEVAPTVDFGTK